MPPPAGTRSCVRIWLYISRTIQASWQQLLPALAIFLGHLQLVRSFRTSLAIRRLLLPPDCWHCSCGGDSLETWNLALSHQDSSCQASSLQPLRPCSRGWGCRAGRQETKAVVEEACHVVVKVCRGLEHGLGLTYPSTLHSRHPNCKYSNSVAVQFGAAKRERSHGQVVDRVPRERKLLTLLQSNMRRQFREVLALKSFY